ncbi:hypothetical protein GCM10010193_66120 [Kitasatospora atroaurantiaca]|uniref:Uncharacterized protein DUF4184 n=1 Tax=Kitasatospora atroaurantiaca TaxID=285545 RepID=A0A561EKF6_9ACTN|nr:DUF4184 family protein [Kitasatospora atroaurantiaca]TWE16108.1 uncharacterized protein DUF4184 [Kitasatospora atroaurantiaca]
MPFTLSHPAAVLPLLRGAAGRGPLIASALVAGAMAPDLPYFADSLLPGSYRHGAVTHRWWAVPTVDVAIAGGLVAAWHGWVRAPLLALLPGRWAAAAEAVTAPSGRGDGSPAWFAVSAAVGAATHVGWDSFTHEDRAGVRAFPVLNRPLAGVPLHTVLQYASSAVALGYVARYAVRVAAEADTARPPGTHRPHPAVRRAGVAAMAGATAAGAAHRLTRSDRERIAEFCFGGGAGLAVGAVAYATTARLFRTVSRRRRHASA